MRNWTLAVALTLVVPLSAHSAPCAFDSAGAAYQAFITRESLPGGAILIGTRQGLLHERYFGSYDAQTVVAIASASKLASAIRIAQLIDRGRIDPEAPVSAYLPAFSGAKGTMTMRQLFSHTSGFGNDSAAPVLLDDSLTLAQAVDQIACCQDFPAGYTVGGQFAYGGISMHIGGRVAEVVSLQDWEVGWQAGLGAPLGIQSIDWQGLGPTRNYMIAGSARSNLRDYGRLLHLLLNEGWANGRRLLSRDAVYRFWQDNVGSLPVIDPPPTATSPVLYGMGSWLDNTRPLTERPLIHSLGAFGYFPWVDFREGLYGIFMIRGQPGINVRGFDVYLDMLQAIRDDVSSTQCELVETVDDIFTEGMEGNGAPR
ncbi:MAG TPA: serine hydrolase domain-containing protein [Xanthomonadales bacterium]|nr:serine hydrolase domain-containing protein [Xanthomonadales bacterium]